MTIQKEQIQTALKAIDEEEGRTVVSNEGMVRLELRAPFAYLKDLMDTVGKLNGHDEGLRSQNKTGGEIISAGFVCAGRSGAKSNIKRP